MNRYLLSGAFFAVATSVIAAVPAQAYTFGNGGIRFDQNTTVEFTFNGGDGNFVSNRRLNFGVADNAGNQLATLFDQLKPGAAPTTASFTFLKDQTYSLFLQNRASSLTLFTTTALNTFEQAKSSGDVFSAAGADIQWEDLVQGDQDFNDYLVNAKVTPVPTPALIPGLIGIGIATMRKRKTAIAKA